MFGWGGQYWLGYRVNTELAHLAPNFSSLVFNARVLPSQGLTLPTLMNRVSTENPSSRPICLERPILKTKWHRGGESINLRSKQGGGHPYLLPPRNRWLLRNPPSPGCTALGLRNKGRQGAVAAVWEGLW